MKRLGWLAGISLLLVSGIAAAACTPLWDRLFLDRTFHSDEWLSGDARVRGLMARHLVASKTLEGKGREEVLVLLGAPEVDRPTVGMSYDLDAGYRWPFNPGSRRLVLWFDKFGEVYTVIIQ
jgi:hypothetical protein